MAKRRPTKGSETPKPQPSETWPPGVKLLRTLDGHHRAVNALAFDARGETLATGSDDRTVKLWDVQSGALLHTLEGHGQWVWSVPFAPQGELVATGSADRSVKLWDAHSGALIRTLEGQKAPVLSVAFDPSGRTLASASGNPDAEICLYEVPSGKVISKLGRHDREIYSVTFDPQGRTLATGSADNTVRIWDVQRGELLATLGGHRGTVYDVVFDRSGDVLASSSGDKTVKLWDVSTRKLLRTLEGHTAGVDIVEFSSDGRLLASKSRDHTVRLWNCENWQTVAIISERTSSNWIPGLVFHPTMPLLASSGSLRDSGDELSRVVHFWQLDYEVLFGDQSEDVASRAIHHTTAKIVLVGDHSVGKSALGYRMIHGRFETQQSTHGQQFWVFPELSKRRADGTECEAILWDFAGQPDYRLVHALFVDNADLALVLFDSTDLRDPLHGVEFWLKQLQLGQSRCPTILVAAQTDRGASSLTPDELAAYCKNYGLEGPIATSAATGLGVAELVERMKSLIPWDDKPATVTTTTFKRIKDYVLGLKEQQPGSQTIVTPSELRARLEATDEDWQFTDAEMLTAVGHLENYGYVKRLRTSKGEVRILLQPERLNNLASSFVLEARRNAKGLGALEEKRLLTGGYDFPELKDLSASERDILLDSAALLFLQHNVCFRETDPLRMEPYLVFPELINLKNPAESQKATDDGVAYTVTGPTENVFASLVVLLGYTHTFTRTAQWQNNARYEMGDGLVCGFRQEAERDGELDLVLCFGATVGAPVRTLFQGQFESFLARRNLTVTRHEPVRCTACGHLLNRSVVRQRLKEGKAFAFCDDCGEKQTLPKMADPIQLTREVQVEVESQRRAAEQRTQFEQAIFRVRTYTIEQQVTPPTCFISYAWGVPEHERWVEKRLAPDLQKAGIDVVLDRWHNAQIGSSVTRFIERIEQSDRIVMVGTPLYRRKYDNLSTSTGYVVAAEVDLINKRLIGTERQKQSVLPLLLDGEPETSLPPMLHTRVHGDFRDELAYFMRAFELILSLYQIPPTNAAVADLLESLRGSVIK